MPPWVCTLSPSCALNSAITLPALQKIFVNFWRIVCGLRFLGNKARKTLEKFGEDSGENS